MRHLYLKGTGRSVLSKGRKKNVFVENFVTFLFLVWFDFEIFLLVVNYLNKKCINWKVLIYPHCAKQGCWYCQLPIIMKKLTKKVDFTIYLFECLGNFKPWWKIWKSLKLKIWNFCASNNFKEETRLERERPTFFFPFMTYVHWIEWPRLWWITDLSLVVNK